MNWKLWSDGEELQMRFKVIGLVTFSTLILMLKDSVLSSHQSIRYSGPSTLHFSQTQDSMSSSAWATIPSFPICVLNFDMCCAVDFVYSVFCFLTEMDILQN